MNYGRFINEVKRETSVDNIPLMHIVNISKLSLNFRNLLSELSLIEGKEIRNLSKPFLSHIFPHPF